MKKVSVIIPVYNVAEYVEQCAYSVITQTFKNIQIILVDDGSDDASVKLCDDIAASDSRVTVIHKPNGGLSSARNAGIEKADGDYLLLLDGDDQLESDAVEKLLNAVEDYGYPDIVQFSYKEVDASGVPLRAVSFSGKIEIVSDEREKYERLYQLGGVGASACTKLISKKLFKELRFKEGIIHEDEYIVTDLLSNSNAVLYYDIAPYLYFFRKNSIVTSGFSNKKMDVFTVIERRIALLREKGFYDLINKEYERMFVTIPFYYAKAKNAGFYDEAQRMKKLFSEIPWELSKQLSGFSKLKLLLIKKFNIMLDVIYLLKKALGRI